MIMGNGGQVSDSLLTRVLASHWSTRHRRRGDAKMMLRHLWHTCTSDFHIPMAKYSSSPRKKSNISRRTSSGRTSTVACPSTPHQSAPVADTDAQQIYIDLVHH